MTSKQIAVGAPIEARCTKCRKITNHIVVAIVDEKPAKVECNTCRGQHLYRKATATPKKTTKVKPNPKDAEQKQWTELREQLSDVTAKEYSMDGEYKVKSLLKHPQFGIGQVQRVVGLRKIEVLFKDGLKTMRCK